MYLLLQTWFYISKTEAISSIVVMGSSSCGGVVESYIKLIVVKEASVLQHKSILGIK